MKSTNLMKKHDTSANSGAALRYGMFIPLSPRCQAVNRK